MHLNEFRKPQDIDRVIKFLKKIDRKIKIMEVCGTHTMAIAKSGIKGLLPENIKLISGPGCPVCVTPSEEIDAILELCRKNRDLIITTYGDMMKVPGTNVGESLEKLRALGSDIRIVYSALDAVEIAKNNQDREVVFLGIGFETTTPGTILALEEAINNNINNFYIYSMHKLVEPALRALLEQPDFDIDGFICPGHVGAVIGEEGFRFLVDEYKKPSVICGFEAGDILIGIFKIINQIINNDVKLENEYKRVVKTEGNKIIKEKVEKYFKVSDDLWRGIGLIKNSGLKLKKEYEKFDAITRFNITLRENNKTTACRCGDVIKGKIEPNECSLFGRLCTPENAVGPCMVSSEGACAAYYKYLQF
ncbi:hydrogenase formation protein HypD [Thermobrachium celere]|uniref:[NiFe] hydrogenase metallocenter assembly protein HypD n=1 Tax=Thermobrachium celere DSM 8682 TaxID=941824 RepID=R7RPP1_9CLOT|nr:hydrogenase formation protein HypD [Thermobrachium celere]CDF58157.1 [NiFe] hydrogenase metallocenter assembly protein HypD [Thermobrachium celere DSM 8682]